MNPKHGRASARPQEPVTPVILNGGAWAARRIRNNCLRQHCHVLATTFRRDDFAHLREPCARLLRVVEARSRILTDLHPNDLAVIAGLARLAAYRDRWVRAPESWQPNPAHDARHQWADLLRHLLARFPLPAHLDRAWEISGPLVHFERDCWCALAQGHSPRTVHGFSPAVSHRVLHQAVTEGSAEGDWPLWSAVWQAQLRVLRASAELKAAVLVSGIVRVPNHFALWVRVVAKFAAGSPADVSHFPSVVKGLVVVRALRGVDQVEAMLRLPLRDLVRACQKAVTAAMETRGYLLSAEEAEATGKVVHPTRGKAQVWPARFGAEAYVARFQRGKHNRWLVVELCTGDGLRAEGRELRHCVGSYVRRCLGNHAAIVSVRREQETSSGEVETDSYATCEVALRGRGIRQIRAYGNQPANNTVMSVIHEWAQAKGIESR